MLVSLVIYTQQEVSSDEEFQLEKRRIDGHARTSIPLFRGSNLGIFVRKRPYSGVMEHSGQSTKRKPVHHLHMMKILWLKLYMTMNISNAVLMIIQKIQVQCLADKKPFFIVHK